MSSSKIDEHGKLICSIIETETQTDRYM